jgi:hypothetical protein
MAQAADAFRPDVPSTARMYDYYLGGKDNYPADREAAERIIAMMPPGMVRTSAVQNRKFLVRVVRHLARDLGVRQFLDIGTGLPTVNSVHQVAQDVAPDSKVVYVDHDPVVLAHSRHLLHGNDRATIIGQDLRTPGDILGDPELRRMLDFSQPVAVLLVAVLHFIEDFEDPYHLVETLMKPMPEGSFLVITHFTADSYSQADVAAQEYQNTSSSVHSRQRSQVIKFFNGYEILPPGAVVWTPQWRRPGDEPEDDPEIKAKPGRSLFWCGVGRKTGLGRPEALPEVTLPQRAVRPRRPLEPPPQAIVPAQPAAGPLSPTRGTPLLAAPTTFDTSYADSYQRLRPDIPNVARMYDYMLGGKDNYPSDREAVKRTFSVLGEDVVRGAVLQNRQFLGRAVRYLAADLGIRQFLDIGTGLPSMNNVHEVASDAAPGSKVVYVDNDPVVLAHARDMLHGVPAAIITSHDLREPEAIIGDRRIRDYLDFGQPIAVLLIAVLHFLADSEDPEGIVSELMAAVPPGSVLVISHLTADHYAAATQTQDIYAETTPGLHLRPRHAVEALFRGYPLLDPGELVYTADWHPDAGTLPADAPGASSLWCGVARK